MTGDLFTIIFLTIIGIVMLVVVFLSPSNSDVSNDENANE